MTWQSETLKAQCWRDARQLLGQVLWDRAHPDGTLRPPVLADLDPCPFTQEAVGERFAVFAEAAHVLVALMCDDLERQGIDVDDLLARLALDLGAAEH